MMRETVIAIQPDDVKNALGAWHRGDRIPDGLLQLHFLDRGIETRYWLEWQLYDWFHETTHKTLTAYRRAVCLKTPTRISRQSTCDEILTQIRSDFTHHSSVILPELLIWSAFYHRYVIPFSLPVNLLADTAAISERQFRRYVTQGLGLLTRDLQKCELDAVSSTQPQIIPFSQNRQMG